MGGYTLYGLQSQVTTPMVDIATKRRKWFSGLHFSEILNHVSDVEISHGEKLPYIVADSDKIFTGLSFRSLKFLWRLATHFARSKAATKAICWAPAAKLSSTLLAISVCLFTDVI